jgi:hypothetical protein
MVEQVLGTCFIPTDGCDGAQTGFGCPEEPHILAHNYRRRRFLRFHFDASIALNTQYRADIFAPRVHYDELSPNRLYAVFGIHPGRIHPSVTSDYYYLRPLRSGQTVRHAVVDVSLAEFTDNHDVAIQYV